MWETLLKQWVLLTVNITPLDPHFTLCCIFCLPTFTWTLQLTNIYSLTQTSYFIETILEFKCSLPCVSSPFLALLHLTYMCLCSILMKVVNSAFSPEIFWNFANCSLSVWLRRSPTLQHLSCCFKAFHALTALLFSLPLFCLLLFSLSFSLLAAFSSSSSSAVPFPACSPGPCRRS